MTVLSRERIKEKRKIVGRSSAGALGAIMTLSLVGCARAGLSNLPVSSPEQREERIIEHLLNQPRSLPNTPPELAPKPPRAEPVRGSATLPHSGRDRSSSHSSANAAKIEPRKNTDSPAPVKPPERRRPAETPVKAKAASASKIRGFWDDRVKHGRLWTRFTAEALRNHGRSLILGEMPADITGFCPRYKKLDESGRIDFWVKLISAIAAAESSYNPRDSYRENMRDSNGDAVVSRGLLQISLASSQPYHCGANSHNDLHDPRLNLECGVKILAYWIPSDGFISSQSGAKWLGGARYWSTLRDYNHNFRSIRALLRNSENCRG